MSVTLAIEALSVAAFARALADLPHETRARVTATEDGTPWARVDVSPMTDTARAVFPLDAHGMRGDTHKRGQSGVIVSQHVGTAPALAYRTVIDRARRMSVTR